ncbi:MAG: DUF2442 domain-containing protein [Balneolaceae bacterium]|nr:DUF2442 domain-containing protein [Balneolaceae bacterium]
MTTIRVTHAEYIGEYKIRLTFSTGESGYVDFTDYLKGTMFEPLKEKTLFSDFKLNDWTIYWENGADFSPEFLHDIAVKNQTILS